MKRFQPSPRYLWKIFITWLPLAASWALMAAELPVLSAIIARLKNPEIHLAAYGSVVSPIALIIESPIIMLLAASTALSKDWISYKKLRRFMFTTSAILTSIHIIIAFTPLYYVVVKQIIGVPEVIVEPARIGLMIMVPWTGSIAYRRFNQGVLIRFGHSSAVWIGTLIRLTADVTVLMIGYYLRDIPGIVVASCAVIAGVVSEAMYIGIRVQPVLNNEVKKTAIIAPQLTRKSFLAFYIPLALTSFLFLFVQPIGSAAMSRMPNALESLAVWPVVSGLIFLLRSLGVAYNEVVVAFLDKPGSSIPLRRFTIILGSLATLILLLVTITPLAEFWFSKVSALSPKLTEMALKGLWIAIPMPALSTLQSWYQGSILHSKNTRGIPEAVIIFLITVVGILTYGVINGKILGLYIGLTAFVAGMFVQTIWLWVRSRPAMLEVNRRDGYLGN